LKVTDTLTNLLGTVLQAIPVIIVFLLILLVGYIVASILRKVAARLLERVGLDRTLHENQYGQYVEKVSPGASPSRLIGTVVFFFVLLGALSVAIAYTGNPGLTAFLAGIYGYLPKVAAAILIPCSPPRSPLRSEAWCNARWAIRAPARSYRRWCP